MSIFLKTHMYGMGIYLKIFQIRFLFYIKEVNYMEDYFKCKDCRDECRCPVDDPDSSACLMFSPKKEVRLSIEQLLFDKIADTKSGEPITFSNKEMIILLEILYKDIKHFKPANYSSLMVY